MSELRLDPMTGRWVVIASDRAHRPTDFLPRRLPVEADPIRPCPFCPRPDDNSVVLASYGSGDDWEVRVLPNIYPAFSGNEPMAVTHLGPVYTQAPASGAHEVVVLSSQHDSSWADLSPAHAQLVMTAIRDRMAEHAATPGLRYSQAVVNSGREAGASVEHPHGQLLSMPFIPGEAANELAGFARFQGNCLLCAVIESELEAEARIVFQDDHVLVICPFWGGTPYEMLIIPKVHETHLHEAQDEDLAAVGRSVAMSLDALRRSIGDVAYNVMFHSAPYRARSDFHWHAHLMPKISTRGGFEMGSGVLINVVAPETGAENLRSAVAAHA